MRITETDASFIYAESASSPMHISSIYVLKGKVPFKRLHKDIHLAYISSTRASKSLTIADVIGRYST